MADKTIPAEAVILINNWPDGVIPALVANSPEDGFTGSAHHNVSVAKYKVGTMAKVYNIGSAGTSGVPEGSTNVASKAASSVDFRGLSDDGAAESAASSLIKDNLSFAKSFFTDSDGSFNITAASSEFAAAAAYGDMASAVMVNIDNFTGEFKADMELQIHAAFDTLNSMLSVSNVMENMTADNEVFFIAAIEALGQMTINAIENFDSFSNSISP